MNFCTPHSKLAVGSNVLMDSKPLSHYDKQQVFTSLIPILLYTENIRTQPNLVEFKGMPFVSNYNKGFDEDMKPDKSTSYPGSTVKPGVETLPAFYCF